MRSNYLLAFLSLFLLAAGLYTGSQAWSGYKTPVIVIKWSTASELDTAGFNILRSVTPNGPFERINSELIPASPDPLTGGAYQYTDTEVEPGKTYYYRLEEIEFGGGSSRSEAHEAVAVRSGLLELGISGFVVLAAIWGLVGLLRRRKTAVAVDVLCDAS